MTTSELISYIEKQIKNNISKELIISKLIGAGWKIEDINEGFLSIESKLNPNLKSSTDIVKEKQKKEDLVIKDKNIENPKIWVPMRAPIVDINKNIEDQEKKEIKKVDSVNPSNNFEIKEKQKKEEDLIPNLSLKKIDSHNYIKNDNFIKDEKSTKTENVSINYRSMDLPKIAMLSSYKKDLLSINNKENTNPQTKNKKKGKWFIFLVVFFVLALTTWVFAGGFISIKDINLPFIKKDPKILLLNNSEKLSSLKSYKTETNIEITSPSFSNISIGLISGEAISSLDKDNILINTLGVISQNDSKVLSDNFITIKSSLLKNYITADIKNNGSDLFISIPDFDSILGDNAPESAIVKINEAQFGLIPYLFSDSISSQLEKINLYNIISSGMSSYINNDTLNIYNDFINNSDILEKGEEVIRGVDTYHYLINVDRQLSKKLLSEISKGFVLHTSDEDNSKLDEILGSITIDSFEVWVGRGDNNIYQYNVILKIPLSKMIGFEDKSVGDNEIKINWKTTYYDFNITNEILMPKDSLNVEDFIRNVNEMKMKNELISFGQIASNFFKVEGTYGKKDNKDGSCMNPISGSLFSPLGHSKKSLTEVSYISEFLNKIMAKTNNNGFCYSTPKAWSFTIPINNFDLHQDLQSENKSLFCVDSTGAAVNIPSSPLGVVCGQVVSNDIPVKNN